jgi:spore coat protein A
MLLDGNHWHDPVTERPELDSVEIWRAPNEAGWKDTVRVDPGTISRIIMKFEGYPGRCVWHCHLLEHAANEMMRPLEVVPR